MVPTREATITVISPNPADIDMCIRIAVDIAVRMSHKAVIDMHICAAEEQTEQP